MARHIRHDGAALTADLSLEADVAVVGSGAGGGIAAEILANAGLAVVMLEEGDHLQAADFTLNEADAYPDLYQESAARRTKDKAILILQGRAVGGGTTVNWTSSFRTPAPTLEHWRERHGLTGYTAAALAPWFEQVERRLNIHEWQEAPPNENNRLLAAAAAKLGYATSVMRRNVKGCLDLGYCGMGCPVDAKQSMLVTTIPAALDRGARLVSRVRVERVVLSGDRVAAVEGLALDRPGVRPTGAKVTVRARHVVLAAGAIGSPAILLRSGAPDPAELLGRRTFLHPVNISAAWMADRVDPFYGAPQSVYSDQFLWPPAGDDGGDGGMGFKLEVPPMHPVLAAANLKLFGADHAKLMRRLPHMHAMLALMRDGFHDDSRGGTVELLDDGSPVLDYPLTDYLFDGLRRSFRAMAEMQFAAGAKAVMPLHLDARPYRSWAAAKAAIDALEMAPVAMQVGSAHVMGGCAMGPDPARSVVDPDGRHHQIENLTVIDGSVFPTAVGANPQLSIFAIAARNATRLAAALG